MPDDGPPLIGSLCSGYLGLDAAVTAVFGGQLAWVAETDPAMARLLEYRMPDVPNLGDLTRIDWQALDPPLILAGGIPCQGWSLAGKRKGHDDERWLWADMAEGVRVLRPRWVVVENVLGLLRRELVHGPCECVDRCEWSAICPACGRPAGGDPGGPVQRSGLLTILGTLASLGYLCSWAVLRASDVGAPHGRPRVFIVGYRVAGAADADRAARGERRVADDGEAAGRRPRADAGGPGGTGHPGAADAGEDGRARGAERHVGAATGVAASSGDDAGGCDAAAADPLGGGPQRRGVAGLVGGAAGPAPGEGVQRERAGDPADGGDCAAAADPGGAGAQGAGDGPAGAGPGGRPGADRARRDAGPGGGRAAADTDAGRPRSRRGGPEGPGGRAEPDDGGDAAADPAGPRQAGAEVAGADSSGEGPWDSGEGAEAWRLESERGGPAVDWQQYGPAIERWEAITGRWAPDPVRPARLNRKRLRDCAHELGLDGWAAAEMVRRGWWGAQLDPRFVEWMMGLEAGWVTSVPGLSRNDMLKGLGNGVVPRQGVEGIWACVAEIAAALAGIDIGGEAEEVTELAEQPA